MKEMLFGGAKHIPSSQVSARVQLGHVVLRLVAPLGQLFNGTGPLRLPLASWPQVDVSKTYRPPDHVRAWLCCSKPGGPWVMASVAACPFWWCGFARDPPAPRLRLGPREVGVEGSATCHGINGGTSEYARHLRQLVIHPVV
jgi:hypothetical protein